MTDFEVQTRDDNGELKFFKTVDEAFKYAKSTPTVWKISFDVGSERLRFVRDVRDGDLQLWKYEPMKDVIERMGH